MKIGLIFLGLMCAKSQISSLDNDSRTSLTFHKGYCLIGEFYVTEIQEYLKWIGNENGKSPNMKLSPCPPEEPYCALYKPHSLHQPFVYKCVPASNKAIAERCKQSGECYTQLHNGGVLITVCCCHNYECQIQLSPILETILEKIVIREKRLLTIAKLGIQKRKQVDPENSTTLLWVLTFAVVFSLLIILIIFVFRSILKSMSGKKIYQNYAVTNMRTLSTNTALKFPSSQSSNCTRRMRTGSAERMTTL